MTRVDLSPELVRLAELCGVQTRYYSAAGDEEVAPAEQLLAVLKALDVPIASAGDIPGAHREAELDRWRRRIEPVIVDWVGAPAVLKLRLPAQFSAGNVACWLHLEDGTVREWDFDLDGVEIRHEATVDGEHFVVKAVPLPDGLPWGYHRLQVTFDDLTADATVITAPVQTYNGSRGQRDRLWGAFLPLYSVHHADGMGFGSYSDLETLVSWVRGLGGNMFGTLPLLPTFLSEPFEPSPYSPVSRRFWNEFYLDLRIVPEMDASATAQAMLLSGETEREISDLRQNEFVDYRRAATIKRKLLSELSRTLLAEPSDRRAAFHEWAGRNKLAREYSRFMATVDREQTTWQAWPDRQLNGLIMDGDFDSDDAHYHLYVQWLAEEQIAAVAGEKGGGGSGLYLDLPLGVHAGGFDVWRERQGFATGARVGAPPDLLNQDGQDWGFPPVHPERVREDGYDYFRQSIQHHMRHAGALRVDHVMGLHRLFWIPEDSTAREGVYVQYRAEEMYAILALESHRNQCLVIGEDLGTVPDEVRTAMAQHQIQRMYVVPFQFGGSHDEALRPVDDGSLATLNTHDLKPFASEWAGTDAEMRKRVVALLHERGWLESPTDDVQTVLGALMRFMADSPASMVLVNLEDLWLETEQQNVPGTIDEHPNWRRKARYDLDAFVRMPRVTDALRELDLLRKRGR
jgi:4-alpha-glucanotransferase